MNAATLTAQRVSVRLLLTGAVQGSGIRPKIARLAVQHGLGGCVRNCQSGVEIEAVGLNISVDLFVRTLQELVPDAQIEQSSLDPSFKYTTCESSDAAVFSIDDSQTLGPAAFVVPLDCGLFLRIRVGLTRATRFRLRWKPFCAAIFWPSKGWAVIN